MNNVGIETKVSIYIYYYNILMIEYQTWYYCCPIYVLRDVRAWSSWLHLGPRLQVLPRELRTATTHDHVQAEKEDIQGPYTTGSAHGGGDGRIQTLQSATVLLE